MINVTKVINQGRSLAFLRTNIHIVGLALTLMLFCAVMSLSLRPADVKAPGGSGIEVIEAVRDVGTVDATVDYVVELALKNNSGQPLHIPKFTAGCKCTSIEPETLTLEANEVGTIRAHIDLIGENSILGSLDTQFGVTIGIGPRQDTEEYWSVSGKVRHDARGLTPNIYLGAAFADSNSSSPIEKVIELKVREHVQELPQIEIDPRLTASISRVAGRPGVANLNISVRAADRVGEFVGTLRLIFKGQGRETVRESSLRWEIVAPFIIYPSVLCIEATANGTWTSSSDVLIKHRHGQEFRIALGTNSSNTAAEVLATKGEETVIRVKVRSNLVGDSREELNVTATRDEQRFELRIPVLVVGR